MDANSILKYWLKISSDKSASNILWLIFSVFGFNAPFIRIIFLNTAELYSMVLPIFSYKDFLVSGVAGIFLSSIILDFYITLPQRYAIYSKQEYYNVL